MKKLTLGVGVVRKKSWGGRSRVFHLYAQSMTTLFLLYARTWLVPHDTTLLSSWRAHMATLLPFLTRTHDFFPITRLFFLLYAHTWRLSFLLYAHTWLLPSLLYAHMTCFGGESCHGLWKLGEHLDLLQTTLQHTAPYCNTLQHTATAH